MMDKKELQGYWKPPGDEDWVGGTAIYHPKEGITLQLFEPTSKDPMMEHPSFDYFIGETTEDGQVTLGNCRQTSSSIGSDTLNTEKYRAQHLFVGDHIRSAEPSFTRFRVNYPLLHQWAGLTGIRKEFPQISDRVEYNPSEIDVHYSPPDTVTAQGNNRTVKILTSANISQSTAGSFSIDENTYLEIVPNSGEISFESLISEVDNWRDFLTFAIDDNIGINELRGYREDESGEESSVQIYYDTPEGFNHPDSYHPHRTNFQLDDLGENPQTVLTNWMQLTERYKSVFDLYFAVVYQTQMYLENQYMMLLSAMNLYYQKRYEYEYLDEERFDAVQKMLANSLSSDLEVDEEFKSHLQHDVLPSANQHSLKKRLTQIVEDHEEILVELPWDTAEEVSELVSVHDYTVGRSSELQEVGPEWIYKKTAFLSMLLKVIILEDLGVSAKHIETQLSRKYARRLDIP